jgi:hypothetical protein
MDNLPKAQRAGELVLPPVEGIARATYFLHNLDIRRAFRTALLIYRRWSAR